MCVCLCVCHFLGEGGWVSGWVRWEQLGVVVEVDVLGSQFESLNLITTWSLLNVLQITLKVINHKDIPSAPMYLTGAGVVKKCKNNSPNN